MAFARPIPKTYWPAVGISVAGLSVLIAVLVYFLVDGLFMQRIVEKLLLRLPAFKIRGELALISKRIFTNKTRHRGSAGRGHLHAIPPLLGLLLRRQVSRISGSITIWLGFVPVILAANAVPVTVFGLGVREPLLVLYLDVLGHVEGGKLWPRPSLYCQ